MAEDFNDPFKLFRDMWKPLETPMPNMLGMLSPEELDKKLQELKVVEGWLSMNLNMLKMSIQALEMQRAALAAMKQATGGKPD